MLISIWSDKGGTGKTTLAVLVGSSLGAGLLDLDPQGDLHRWAEKAAKPCERLTGDSSARLVSAAKDDQAWVVDCPPGTEPQALQGMAYSQVVIIPTRSGDADLVALGRALEAVRLIQNNGNSGLRAAVVLNATRETSRARGISEALRVSPGYAFLGEIRERVAYEEAYSRGRTISEAKGPAVQEARVVLQALEKLIR